MKNSIHIIKLFFILISFLFSGVVLFGSVEVPNDKKLAYPIGFYKDDPVPDKTAFLTFDDGPSDWTDGILDVLKGEDIKGTFFVCSNRYQHRDRVNNSFKKYHSTIERMIAEGHAIGNHTADHRNLASLSRSEIEAQFDDNQDMFNKEMGPIAFKMTLIRPPYGSPWYKRSNESVRERVGSVVEKRGVLCMWSRMFDSADSVDWVRGETRQDGPSLNMAYEEYQRKIKRIFNRLSTRTDGSGMVILFHDTHPTTMSILPKIIADLKRKGYKFGTLDDYSRWRWGFTSAELIGKI